VKKMMPEPPSTWILVLLLGGVHGINPAMGWLFAVGLGLQEQSRRAVWGALGPMALGHALAIGVAVIAAAALGRVIPADGLTWLVAATLLGFGLFHLLRHRHPRWVGMRVGARDLTIWSFLMASAHGAGVMVLPLVLGGPGPDAPHAHPPADGVAIETAHGEHLLMAGFSAGPWAGATATLVHTVGYLLVTGIIAVIVYEKLGLRLLRGAWINLNVIWAGALVATAALTVLR
jgi:hypothetical protein